MLITLLFIIGSLLWLLGFVVLWRLPSCANEQSIGSLPRVTIIIPARNEEMNLKTLLPSIKAQSVKPHEVFVINDHSEDQTSEVAQALGAQVITAQQLPKGWLGKAWACQQGANAATGEVLLFLDADTKLEKNGLARMMATFQTKPQVLSISPYHHVPTWGEQGSSFFNLMQMMGMKTFTILGNKLKPVGMFGPCLVINKSDYDDIGGHGAVVGEVLENYALAKPLMNAGKQVTLINGKGVLSVRMYPEGLKAVVAGWTKSFTIGASQTPPMLMTLVTFWLTGLIVAMVGMILYLFGGLVNEWWLGLYSLYVLQLIIHLKRIGSYSIWTALLFPLPLIFFFYIYANTMMLKRRGQDVLWKGRKIKQ